MVASNGCLRERNNLDGIIIMQDLIAKMGLLCDVGRTCLVCVNKLLLAVEITVAQEGKFPMLSKSVRVTTHQHLVRVYIEKIIKISLKSAEKKSGMET